MIEMSNIYKSPLSEEDKTSIITGMLNQWTLESLEDKSSGDVDSPAGWFALFKVDEAMAGSYYPLQAGGYILQIDTQGFQSYIHYADVADAESHYEELEAEYSEWLGDKE